MFYCPTEVATFTSKIFLNMLMLWLQVVDPVLSTKGLVLTDMANTNLMSGSESPVNTFPPNAKGFHDTLGNAWEW